MNISKINEIFAARGREAALATARAAMMPSWVIGRLSDGTWDPNHKPATKPVATRQVIDRNGDQRLIKVSLAGEMVRYLVETTGESGSVVSTIDLGKASLASARAVIGRVIEPPKPANFGKPTNDPSISREMKGKNGGKGK